MNKRLYIINQHYYPELASTAQVFQEIAEYFVTIGYDVTVIAGLPFYHGNVSAEYESITKLNGVKIKRLWNTTFNKSSFFGKSMNLLTFQISLLVFALLHICRSSIVMVGTNPPLAIVSAVLAAILKGFKLISVVQDLYPDILISSGYSDGRSLPYILLSKVMRWSFNQCHIIVTISEDMKKYIQTTYRAKKVHVINNMVIGNVFPVNNYQLKEKSGLTSKLVVMYSGNFGVAHEYYTLFGAVRQLSSNENIVFRIVGGGVNYEALKTVCSMEGLSNITFLPYVDKEELNSNLNIADIHMIIFNDDFKNVLMPSKYYGILASGRPLILITDSENDITRDIDRYNMGYIVERGNSQKLVDILLDILRNKNRLSEMGEHARRLYNERYAKELVFARYRQMLEEL